MSTSRTSPVKRPFVAASAAVFRDGCILLIKREDNGLWAMPGGWTEVGETWAQSVERELREETGLACTAKQLLGVFDSTIMRQPLQVSLLQ